MKNIEINIKTPEQREFEEIAKALVAIYAKLDPDARHEVFSYAAYKYAQREAEKEAEKEARKESINA